MITIVDFCVNSFGFAQKHPSIDPGHSFRNILPQSPPSALPFLERPAYTSESFINSTNVPFFSDVKDLQLRMFGFNKNRPHEKRFL